MYKKLITPERLRQIPANFSWIDHRLVRHGHLKHLSCESIAFYLFLVSVGDSQGLSYYSNNGISKLLTLKSVSTCRQELIQFDLLSYSDGVYQVLDLREVATYKKPSRLSPIRSKAMNTPTKPRASETSPQKEPDNVGIPECLRKLLEDLS
jgi:hypothetical protein